MSALISTWLLLYLPLIGAPALLWSSKLLTVALLSSAALALQPKYRPAEASASDRGTARVFALGLFPYYLATVLEARFRGPELAATWDAISVVALGCAVFGLFVRTWAVRSLGRFFTLHVQAVKGQTVIKDGPYRYVRHPAYTGGLFMLLATPAILGSWWTFAAGAVLFPWWFTTRIRQEEAVLLAALGTEYAEYRARTPALLPSVRQHVVG